MKPTQDKIARRISTSFTTGNNKTRVELADSFTEDNASAMNPDMSVGGTHRNVDTRLRWHHDSCYRLLTIDKLAVFVHGVQNP